MNSGSPWPQVVYTVLMSRWPEFAAAVVNESMALMSADPRAPDAMTAKPAYAVERREHHTALREASAIFLESLKAPNLPQDATRHVVPLPADDDCIVVRNIPFSKRHFARNYAQQFSADVQAFYNQTYGFVAVNAQLTDAELQLEFVRDTEA